MKVNNKNLQLLSPIIIFAILLANLSFPPTISAQKGAGNLLIDRLPSKEKRWALIIGVDTYQKDISPLYGTVNDAKALRDVLIRYAGFADERIILMTTDSNDADLIPTRGNIIDQLDKLQRVVPEDGLILFSFSGHGVSIGSDAFIVPADGRIYQNADLMRERAIDVLRIKRAIQATKVKQVIMFLDACRNEPVRAKGDGDNNLTTAYAKGFSFETKNQNIEAYATLYATSFGDRAYEFLDKKTNKYRGYFSYAIEEALKGKAANDKGEVTLGSLIRYIEDTVKERVRINENQRQIPYPTTEGFRNSDLVIAIANKSESNLLSPAQVAWNNFRGTAKKLTKYDSIYRFNDELAQVCLNNKCGFLNKSGDIAIELKFEVGLGYFSEGFATVKINGKSGYLDKTGKLAIPPVYEKVTPFNEGLATVELGGKQGYIDKTGNRIIPIKYEFAISSFEGLLGVGLNEKAGFIDKTDKVVIPFEYDSISAFSEGLASVEISTEVEKPHCQYINKRGQVVLNTFYVYNSCERFSEGLAAVGIIKGYDEKNEETIWKWGFINNAGKKITELIYDKHGDFEKGLAAVVKDKKLGFIDKNGNEVIPLKYDDDEINIYDGLVRVSLNKKIGFLDSKGNVIIPFKYDSLWCHAFIKEGFIGVKLNGKKGFVDIYGNEYFDF